ncbi:MAG: DUF3419 family protein [Geminicoccaceae bacterium]
MANVLLREAAEISRAGTKQRWLERLFTLSFEGFVYNQIWEDPRVDLEAMGDVAGKNLLTIASGGCNVLAYLDADPRSITAVDLNPAHVALTRLKLTALERLPAYEPFFSFFAHGDREANVELYDRYIAPHLDPDVRAFWGERDLLGRRRIRYFADGFYRRGLFGRFLTTAHVLARLLGGNPAKIVEARSVAEQRELFERHVAPVFDHSIVRWLARTPLAYYGLGIPPAQHQAMVQEEGKDMLATMCRERVERLVCGFPLDDNYFAWQACARRYDTDNRKALPDYLKPAVYERIKERVGRVSVVRATLTDHLSRTAGAAVDRFVFLDAQDWMSRDQINDLWREVSRAGSADAKVIFRTAGAASPLDRKLSPELACGWDQRVEESQDLHRRDRSAIYGGFHLYSRLG